MPSNFCEHALLDLGRRYAKLSEQGAHHVFLADQCEQNVFWGDHPLAEFARLTHGGGNRGLARLGEGKLKTGERVAPGPSPRA